MNNPHKYSNTKAFVLYWEEAFAQSFFHVEKLLDAKCKYLEKLRKMLFDEMKEDVSVRIKNLETEINQIIGLLDMVQLLKKAYLEETAQIASLLSKLTCEKQVLLLQNQELRERNDLQDNVINLLLSRCFTTLNEENNEY